jgi:hypothetical protein
MPVGSGSGQRAALAAGVRAALTECVPDSSAELRGSLAAGTADFFSDIDIAWLVPDAAFPACLALVVPALHPVAPVAEVRTDPDLAHSDRRRLLFVRFAGVPLFWRLDLDVRTASVAADPHHDESNPAARAADHEWSRPASALANAIAAVKAVARNRDAAARALLDRAFTRINVPDHATGDWQADLTRLTQAATRQDPALSTLAADVTALATHHLKPTDPGKR